MKTKQPMVRVACPHCEARIQAPAKYRGRNIRCPKCKQGVAVPVSSSESHRPTETQTVQAPEPPPVPQPAPVAPEPQPAPVAPSVSVNVVQAQANESPQSTWSSGTARILAFFLPGLGHLYKGQLLRGFIVFCLQGLLNLLAIAMAGSSVFTTSAAASQPGGEGAAMFFALSGLLFPLMAFLFWVAQIWDAGRRAN